MFGFYTPVLIFQIFCIYHAYRNNVEQRWYWLILFFPLGGSIIYLAYNFGNRSNLEKISETVKVVVNSNYRTDQLELALRHSDNVSNRINLADEYCNLGRYDEAISLYRKCQEGFMSDDPLLRMKLIRALYAKQDYAGVVSIAEELKTDKTFQSSEERAAYAWSLHHTGSSGKARSEFEALDKTYCNYRQRLEFCRFLELTGDRDGLIGKANELTEELTMMKGPERKLHRNEIRQVEDIQNSLSRTLK